MFYQSTTAIADGAGYDHMGGWGWAGMTVGLVLMAVLVAVVAWAILSISRPRAGNQAVELLSERYARGEIDRDEYTERRVELNR